MDFAAALPGDAKVAGFDTGAEALQDAGDSVSVLMEVSRRALEGIRFLDPPPPDGLRLSAELGTMKEPRRDLDRLAKDAGLRIKARRDLKGVGVMMEPKWGRRQGGPDDHPAHSGERRGGCCAS